MIRQNTFAAALAATLLLCTAALPCASAEETEKKEAAVQHELITELQTNPVEYRRLIKEAIEGHLGAFGLILMMRAPDTDNLPLHAEALVWLTRVHGSLYPEGSATAGTRAAIWTNPEEFGAASKRTEKLAVDLEKAVGGGNRHLVLNSMVKLAESCESCHAQFRESE